MEENLIEAIQSECSRCRELLTEYEAIGPAGAFGRITIGNDIKEAEAAIASMDAVRMIAALKALRGCE